MERRKTDRKNGLIKNAWLRNVAFFLNKNNEFFTGNENFSYTIKQATKKIALIIPFSNF